AAIDGYKQLAISPQQQLAIDRFRQVVDRYAEKYELSKQLIDQGWGADLIERQVRVDDGPGLQALEYLSAATLKDSHANEAAVERDIARVLAFMDWGWLLVPLLVLVSAVVILMLYRLTKSNEVLESAKQYADDVLKAAPDAMIVVGKAGTILNANLEAQSLFGYSADELVGMKLEQMMPERFRQPHSTYVNKAFEVARPQSMNKRSDLLALTKSGKEISIEINLSYTSQDGETQSIAAIRDVSMRKQAEGHMRLARKVLDDASEGILITDKDACIVDMNAAFCQLSGYGRDELLGQSPSILSSGRHDRDFYQQMWLQLAKLGYWKGEIWDRRKGGELIPSLVSISAVVDEADEVSNYVAVYSDITDLKEKEQQLEQLAHFDGLTGLANRMLFHDRLRAAMHRSNRRKKCCAVMYIDLDGFKLVNDRLGHAAGDNVLVQVSAQIRDSIREDDTAARLGGDEFAIIFNELADRDDVDMLAERVLKKLTFEVNSDAETLFISASIGVAIYPDHGDSIEGLLQCADQAMYDCKRHGKKGYRRFSNEKSQ
ncbi:MAG TPA: sensor domain-containing diguanylate cyclase, partial [Candidatus Tenderia electrophaga]|nr:sensor domain-containing diguanylate cyclase [Candidatus Tenderia electrophaga]